MDKYRSNASSIFYRISFTGLVIILLTVFFFSTESAEMQSSFDLSDSILPERNLALGRLAFTRASVGPAPSRSILTSNPDGSGQSTLPTQNLQQPGDPSWSPDGAKIAFFASPSNNPGTSDIYASGIDGSGPFNLTNTSSASEINPSWSAAGKIAYERRASSDSAAQIWTMNADGSGQAQFPGITQFSPGKPAWSPDAAKLAYVSQSVIWVINADGTNPQQVTSGTDPAWSPDGTKIVFTGGSGIYVVNADGTNIAPIATGNLDSVPAWSPDGTKIAFRRNSGDRGLYTMDANGANQIRVFTDFIQFPLCCDTVYDSPAWQPVAQTPNTFTISGRVAYNNLPVVGATVNLSGTTNAAAVTDAVGNYQFSELPAGGNYMVSASFPRYYFTPPNRSFSNLSSNQTGNNFEVLGLCQSGKCVRNGKIAFSRDADIFTINPDGTAQTNITNNAAGNGAPNYSPDGSNIVFNTNRDGNIEIYRMNPDGGNPVRLTNSAASDYLPYYSPDGASIVFVSDRDGNIEIYKMNADGSNQIRLTNNTASDSYPAFSPDGQKIIYVSNSTGQNKLFAMNADGSNPQPFPDSFGFSPVYERPSYSPDGSKIIFTYSSDASTQIRVNWTMNADGTNRAVFPVDGSYGTYSPDGTKVAYTCCIFNNTNYLRTANADGSSASVRTLTPSNTGNSLPDWQGFILPRAPFDFDGDGKSDHSIFRAGTGDWWFLSSINNTQNAVHWGLSDDVLAPADYDGDLKTDFAVWRPSNGNFYILNSFNFTFRIENFGLAGDVPTGGDFDGDSKADLAVYRPGAQGVFYYRASMGNPSGNITVIPWGITGDKPVAGDFDGDGRTDAAIYRPSNGAWYIRKSSDGQLSATAFGLSGDTLVPADYDGDGKTDLAVYRGGIWYILRSSQGSLAFQYGLSKDIPVPADYDGDGRADAAIYRSGDWWILKSQTGATEVVSFGIGSDKPIPAAYIR